jgi:hypothetical protein
VGVGAVLVRLEEGVARYEGFSVGFPRLSSLEDQGPERLTCNHRRTGSSFHVLGSRSDFASFGAEHSSGPREVGHHRHALHAWVTLSPRGAAVWRLLLTRTYLPGERFW